MMRKMYELSEEAEFRLEEMDQEQATIDEELKDMQKIMDMIDDIEGMLQYWLPAYGEHDGLHPADDGLALSAGHVWRYAYHRAEQLKKMTKDLQQEALDIREAGMIRGLMA